MSPEDRELGEEGRRVLAVEAAAVAALSGRVGEHFVRACRLVASSRGRVLVCGIGKSGHVARKIAATLTATGTPATFLHPVEALHGDLGIVGRDDVAIVVTKSGGGCELGGLLDYLHRLGVPMIALVGRVDADVAAHARAVLDCSVAEEACPMDLVPTSSTTAALAMGDALAMVVLRLRGFGEEDFAVLHPGGALGRKLSVRVRDVMVSEAFPWLTDDARMKDAIAPLAGQRGTVPIVDRWRRIVGVLTAGDLTRLMEHDENFLERAVIEVMTRDPKTATPDELGSAAANRMERHGVMALPVVGEGRRLVGIVHLHDLMRAGAV